MEGGCLVREERLRMVVSVIQVPQIIQISTFYFNLHLTDIQFQ